VAERKVFRGTFAILQTPFTMGDEMDAEDLAREADFCVRAGGHGLVWPQLGAEFYLAWRIVSAPRIRSSSESRHPAGAR